MHCGNITRDNLHIISFYVSFLSGVDELNKLACLQCMDLHSSAGSTLQRERRGYGFESRWSGEKLFFGVLRNCVNCDSTAMVTYPFSNILVVITCLIINSIFRVRLTPQLWKIAFPPLDLRHVTGAVGTRSWKMNRYFSSAVSHEARD